MLKPYVVPRSHIDRAFQLSVELLVSKTPQETIRVNAKVIYDWIKEKFPYMGLLSCVPNDFSKTVAGNTVDIFYRDGEHFCCRIEHPDKKNAGRVWTTEAEIILAAEKVLFGVKVSYTTPENADLDRNIFSTPNFVKQIAVTNGFSDVRKLNGKVLKANSKETLKELCDLITNRDRICPVIVVTDLNDTFKPIFEPENLSKDVGLFAHIAYIPDIWTYDWRDLTGKNWDVYNGAIRTYYKNVDFANAEDLYRHPLFTAKRIAACEYVNSDGEEKFGESAFESFLIEKIKNNDTGMRLDWKSRGHKFLFTARQEAKSQERKIILEKFKDTVDQDWEDLFKKFEEDYEAEREQLKQEIERLENELLDREEENENLKKELDEARTRRYFLESRITALEQKFSETGKVIEIIPNECTYEALSQWVENYFCDKIILLPKVKKSLSDMKFKDCRLVYEALKLLGTEYFQMKMGDLTKADFDEKCKALKLKYDRASTDVTAGMQGDEYFPLYKGKKRRLDFHLTKGVSREAKDCLRIYFFWDDENSVVVVGWLLDHLDTRDT